MDACFIVVTHDDRVSYIESIKGSSQPDTINKCVKFVLSNLS